MSEFLSFVELIGMLLGNPRMAILFTLLVIAAFIDRRTLKIPNWLTLGGTAFALVYSAFVPFLPGQGFLWSLGGTAIGFFTLLPLYALRAMGAGDVKLMAMTGAFLGMADIIAAILASFIVGGAIALAFAVYHRVLWRLLGNLKSTAELLAISSPAGAATSTSSGAGKSVGKLPFGVSIAAGTIGYVVTRQLGFL